MVFIKTTPRTVVLEQRLAPSQEFEMSNVESAHSPPVQYFSIDELTYDRIRGMALKELRLENSPDVQESRRASSGIIAEGYIYSGQVPGIGINDLIVSIQYDYSNDTAKVVIPGELEGDLSNGLLPIVSVNILPQEAARDLLAKLEERNNLSSSPTKISYELWGYNVLKPMEMSTKLM